MKKEVHIQLFRIISMFMIVICHILEESSNNFIVSIGQLFNVGVFCFIFISGYLYSNKKIIKYLEWIKKRLKRILIPLYIFMFILFIINFARNDLKSMSILIYLLNMQYYLGYTTGGEHLWFLTIIMICYFLIPLLKHIENKINLNFILLFLLIMGTVGSYINFKIGFTILYIFTFIFGYNFHKIETNINIGIIKSFFLIIFSVVIRLLSKNAFDGTPLYDIIFFSLTHLMLSVGLYYVIKYVTNFFEIKENRIVNYIDELSFYIYITHNIFISKPLEMLKLTNFHFINIILALFCSTLLALEIKKIDKFIQNINIKEN